MKRLLLLFMAAVSLFCPSCTYIGPPYYNEVYTQTTSPLPAVNGITFSSAVSAQRNLEYGRKEPFQFNIHAEAPKGINGTIVIHEVQVHAGKKQIFQREFHSLKAAIQTSYHKKEIEGVQCYLRLNRPNGGRNAIWFSFRNLVELRTHYHKGQVVTVTMDVSVIRQGRTERQQLTLSHLATPESGLIRYTGP